MSRIVVPAAAAAALIVSLTGCGAVHTAIAHRDLDVQSKMTDTIFLDPVEPGQQTVYVQVRNTSDRDDFDLSEDLRAGLERRSHTVVNDPERAHYLLQVNVLQVGKIDPSAAERMFAGGYGSTIGTAGAGATIGALSGGTWMAAGIGGLVGGASALVADALVKDVTYSVITDVQVSERSAVAVRERTNQRLQQGRSGTRDISAEESSGWKRYQMRVISSANQVNLDLEDALPALRAGVARSIAGTF
jgi:hypothetical protein